KGSGKTTSIVLSAIQKLKGRALEDAPRVLIFVKDKQAALDLEADFNPFIRGTDLRVYCAYDEKNIDTQRDEIYAGTDIVIATPKRLNKIFFLNGINLNKLKMCIVEDAEFLLGSNSFSEVTRTPESIGKCQYLIFTEKFDKRFERWQDTFMINSQIIKI
ncbi:MAG: DEAD/DEAH box helicase, partial [Leeuwenhoekiella sp.]